MGWTQGPKMSDSRRFQRALAAVTFALVMLCSCASGSPPQGDERRIMRCVFGLEESPAWSYRVHASWPDPLSNRVRVVARVDAIDAQQGRLVLATMALETRESERYGFIAGPGRVSRRASDPAWWDPPAAEDTESSELRAVVDRRGRLFAVARADLVWVVLDGNLPRPYGCER